MTSVAPPSVQEAMEALLAASEDPWSATVARHLVHRQTVAEVLVTGIAQLGEGTAAVAAQWARAQPFYASSAGRHDETLVLETLRQAGLAVCHAQLGVSLDRQFLLRDLSLRVLDPSLLRVGDAPARLVVSCRLLALRQRRGDLREGRVEATVHRDGRPLAEASSTFSCVAPGAYGRLRATARRGGDLGARSPHRAGCAPAARAGEVGRLRPEDVLVCTCAGDGAFGLRVDPGHPFFFDHPLDHVPGMAVLEACRQAAALWAHDMPAAARVGDGAIAFAGIVPLEGLVRLEVGLAPRGALVVRAGEGATGLARSSFRVVPLEPVPTAPVVGTGRL